MPYVNPDHLEEDWNSLPGDWGVTEREGGVVSINPAGQLYLDLRALTLDLNVGVDQVIGDDWGNDDYYVQMRFKADKWDGDQGTENYGIELKVGGTNYYLLAKIGSNDGWSLRIHAGSSWVVKTSTEWGNTWHIITFFVHNGGTDVDVWIDKDPRLEEADITDAVCELSPSNAGYVQLIGWGTPEGNGEYHIDYLYIGSELGTIDYTLPVVVGTFTLTGITAVLSKIVEISVTVGTFVLTGVAVNLLRPIRNI